MKKNKKVENNTISEETYIFSFLLLQNIIDIIYKTYIIMDKAFLINKQIILTEAQNKSKELDINLTQVQNKSKELDISLVQVQNKGKELDVKAKELDNKSKELDNENLKLQLEILRLKNK